jgi:hypothetical protein
LGLSFEVVDFDTARESDAVIKVLVGPLLAAKFSDAQAFQHDLRQCRHLPRVNFFPASSRKPWPRS